MGINMKRLLPLLLFLLLCCAVQANAGMNGYIAGSVASSGTTYTDCSQIGTHAFVWFGDYSGDTDKGCKGASTAVDGTLTTGASVVSGGTDPGTASGTSAGNVLKLEAADDGYIRWSITDADILDTSEGLMCFDVYLAATASFTAYLSRIGSTDYMLVNVNAANVTKFMYEGQDVLVSATSATDVADETWTNVCVRWSVSNNKIGIKVGAGSWAEQDSGTVTAWNAGTNWVYFGYNGVSTAAVYMDNLTIDKASGL